MQIGIIGATGYTGVELIRLLSQHDKVKIKGLSSQSYEGQKISEVYPALANICDIVCTHEDEVITQSDYIFACLPHGLSQPLAKKCYEKGKPFIDLGADFRLKDEKTYKQWYNGGFEDINIHKYAVYGLTELYRDEIRNAKVVANPGCYPTASVLALYPALKNKLIDNKSIIIDAKSGVTGAGRSPSSTAHFANLNEGFAPYNIGKHRHQPEIEQALSGISGTEVAVTFTPHLLPINRGILATTYSKIAGKYSLNDIYEIYNEMYKDEFFIRLKALGTTANLKNVKYSNYCDISLHLDEHTSTLIVVSAIDNMVKGACGQAIQNMNLMMGLSENHGLKIAPTSF